MQKHTLKAEKRKVLGRKVKSLRREGVLPANVYGKKVKSLAIQVKTKDFNQVYQKARETGIVELVIGKTKKPSLIQNIQLDPVSDMPLHIDFFQVDLKEKVTAAIPLELIGESPAEKSGLGTVVQYVNEVEVEALPTNLPEKFEVDLSKLTEVDQTVSVKDLTVDAKKVEVKADLEQVLVKVEPPRKEEEEVAPPAEEVAEEVEGEEEKESSAAEAKEGEEEKKEKDKKEAPEQGKTEK